MNPLHALAAAVAEIVDAMPAEDRLVKVLTEHLAGMFPDGVSVWLRPPSGGPLTVAVPGHAPESLARLTDLVRAGAGGSLEVGQPVVSQEEGFGGALCVAPMRASGRLVGVIAGTVPVGAGIDADTVRAATALADMAAVALVSAREATGPADAADSTAETDAAIDPLTGLPNRAVLTTHLYEAFARARRGGTPLAVLSVDLLQFRMINSVYGREAGDELIRSTGARLMESVRDRDAVGRVRGDGFGVVLERAGSELDVELAADRIARSLVKPVKVGDDLVRAQATIGAVLLTDCAALDISPGQFLDLADQARHAAKAAGTTFALEHLTPRST